MSRLFKVAVAADSNFELSCQNGSTAASHSVAIKARHHGTCSSTAKPQSSRRLMLTFVVAVLFFIENEKRNSLPELFIMQMMEV